MARVAVLFDGVTRGVKGAANETRAEIRKVKQESDGANRSALSLGSALRSTLGLGAKIAGGGIVALAGSVAFAGFKFDDLKQKAEIAFTTMLGSGGKARAFLGELQQFANRTPFEFPDLIRTSQRLLAMGVQAKDVIPSLTAIGDAVASLGGGAEQINQVTLAIGQMGLKGRAQSEEMLQLTEAGINGWKYLARALNVDVARAQEMVTKRMVDGRFAQRAILAGMEADFHGSMDKQSHTFSGLWSTIKDTFTQVSGTVMKPFFDLAVRGMQRLVDETSKPEFTAGVQRFAKELAERAVPAIQRSIGWLVTHKDDILDVLRGIRDAGVNAARVIGQIATFADRVAKNIGGWDNAVKIALSAVVMARMAAFVGQLTGAKTQSGGLVTNMLKLKGMGPITLTIALSLIHKSGIRQGLRDKYEIGGDLGGAVAAGAFSGTALQENIVATAIALGPESGKVYVRGGGRAGAAGTPQKAYDCSGYLYDIYRRYGITIPGTAGDQFHDSNGMTVSLDDLEPGDGVYFFNGSSDRQPGHAGIVVAGHGRSAVMIDYFHTGQKAEQIRVVDKGLKFAGGKRWLKIESSGKGKGGDTTGGTTAATDIDVGANAAAAAGAGKAKTPKILSGSALLTQRTRKLLAGADTRGEQLAAYKAVEADLEADLKHAHGKQRDVIEVELEKTRKKIRELEAKGSAERTARLRESTKKAMDVWQAHLDEMKKRVEVAQSALSDAFGKLSQRALAEFDKQTKTKVDALEAERAILTPKEKELADLLAGRAQKARDAAIAGARSDLEQAQAEGDPDKIAQAQKELDDALFEQAQFDLEQAAQAERAARDKEYADKRQALEDERALERDHFEEQLKALEEFLGDRHNSIATANEKLIALFKQFGIDLAGLDITPVTSATATLRGEQARAGDATVGPDLVISGGIATVGTGAGAVNIPKEWLGFAGGGRVPGPRFVNSRDTVLAGFRPGERVINEEQQAWLEQIANSGVTVHMHNPTFLGATEREVMQGLARSIDPYLKRRVGFDRI